MEGKAQTPKNVRVRRARTDIREALLQSALLEFGTKGFDGASTRAIAQRIEAHQPQINYHFKSKEILWTAAVDYLFGLLGSALNGLIPADLTGADVAQLAAAFAEGIRRFVRFAAEHPELNQIMVHEGTLTSDRLAWMTGTHVKPFFNGIRLAWQMLRDAGVAASIDGEILWSGRRDSNPRPSPWQPWQGDCPQASYLDFCKLHAARSAFSIDRNRPLLTVVVNGACVFCAARTTEFLYHVHHGSPLSRSPEYIMSTHASPDDVCFTRGDLAPVLEGRPPVGGPRHLEDAGGPLHALHPKTRSKRSALRSATNCATAARNTACWSAESASKSAPKRANQAKVGTLCQRARRGRRGAFARLPKAVRNSSPEPKISRRSPARSVSASRSPSCHSFVQNHAWVASMTFWGRSRIPSAVISASRRSPSSRCAAARISSGRVSCPLARSVVLDTDHSLADVPNIDITRRIFRHFLRNRLGSGSWIEAGIGPGHCGAR
jgi:TetR/AcrR family transcriptional regulator